MSPKIYWEHMMAHQTKIVTEHKVEMSRLYVGAYLHRVAHKDFPTLESLLGEKKEKLSHDAVVGHLRAMSAKMPTRSWDEWLAG